MQDEYYYSGSGFYEESDASNVNALFTDVSDLSCPFAEFASKRARRYGQWWMLTGVNPNCPDPANAQQRLRLIYSQVVTLNHPSITRAVAMTQTPLFADECVIEEYIDGVTLVEFMRSQPDEATCQRLLDQIIDALQYCHSKGVSHGNLSPNNIKVTHQDNIAKLIAFRCEGNLQDDISSLGGIINTLGLHSLKSVVDDCRNGHFTSIDGIRKAITGRKAKRWIPIAAFALILTAFAAGAFWAGHYTSMKRDNHLADSLPLPGIYFSDTVNLSLMAYTDEYNHFYSTITGANIYFLNILKQAPGDIPENIAVDLGLKVLWAPFNLGSADADVNHVGGFFIWCDTVGQGPFMPLDNYWPQNRQMRDISGTTYDGVSRTWGHGWRIPTHDEWSELVQKCKWTLVQRHGIPLGYRVHGPSGASIFLPMAGYKLRYRDHEIGTVGRYWSSTPVTDLGRNAYAVHFDTIDINLNDTVSLEYGLAVRPVLDK